MNRRHVFVLTCATLAGAAILAAQSNTGPVTHGRSVCVPYDPAGLKLVQLPRTGDWQLQRADGAIFKLFANREDAEAGLAVAREHTQLCYIGKGNTKPDRRNYIMEYWK